MPGKSPGLVFVSVFMLAGVACNRPIETFRQKVEDREAARRSVQRNLTPMVDKAMMHDTSIADIHIVPHTIELGVNPINAANVLSALGGMAVLGNFVLGSLCDRIGSRHIFIIGLIMWTVAFAWLLQAEQMWMLYIFAVILGFAEGGMGPAGSPLVADYFGLKSHGLIFGVVDIGFPIGALPAT